MSGVTTVRKTDTHKALVALVLHAFPSIRWRHHGIGVLQGYLVEGAEPELRVHVWSPSLVKPGIVGNGDVHDHRFDMVSHVLAGTVLHEEWFLSPHSTGPYVTTLLTHARAAADTKFHGPTTTTEDRFVAGMHTHVIREGYTYTFPAKVFHRSPVVDLAVTLVEKHHQRKEPARILHPYGAPFVPAFGHDDDSVLIVNVLKDAQALLEEGSGAV